ncbi:MAG TPA: LEA type 2 family protein [Methanoregulaceae archaeon]|nr:LEA type 2 family protein [Methanoregulaceae archaeon]
MSMQFSLLLCMLIAGGVIVSGCSFLIKDPEISVKGVALSSVSLTDLTLDVTLSVNNANPVGITLKSLEFDIYYQDGGDWIYLSHGEQAGIEVRPGLNEMTIPVTVDNAELIKSLFGLVTRGEMHLKIQGVALPDFFGISPKVPFVHTTTISL